MAKKKGKKGKKGSKKPQPEQVPDIPTVPQITIVPTCEFEAICRKRIHFGEVQYLIKWKDFDEDHNSWEPLSHLEAVLPQIQQFEEDELAFYQSQSRYKHLSWQELESGKREEPGMNRLQNEIGSAKWEVFVRTRLLQRSYRHKQTKFLSFQQQIHSSHRMLERLEDILNEKNEEQKNYRFIDEPLSIKPQAQIEQKQKTTYSASLKVALQCNQESHQSNISVLESIVSAEIGQRRIISEQQLQKNSEDLENQSQIIANESQEIIVFQQDSRVDTEQEAIYYNCKNPQQFQHVVDQRQKRQYDICREEVVAYINILCKYNIVLSPDGDEPLIQKILNNLVYEHRLKSKNNLRIIQFNRIYKIRPSLIFEVKLSDRPHQQCYVVLRHMMQYFFNELTAYLSEYYDNLVPNRT